MPDVRHTVFVALTAVLIVGTTYSVVHNTYLDTSDPVLAALPHPAHHLSYWARKENVLNQLFIKKAWGWSSAAFLLIWSTSPRRARTRSRLFRWAAATALWLLFTTWFFGPALGTRITALTGAQCVLRLPHGALLPVHAELCVSRAPLSPATHPALFATPLLIPDGDWRSRPRLVRGHDISGHVFLLTLSLLFLADQLRVSIPLHRARRYSAWAVSALVALWLFALWTTSLYFHTPFEKFTGYLVGVAAFFVTQLPVFEDPTPAPPDAYLRED